MLNLFTVQVEFTTITLMENSKITKVEHQKSQPMYVGVRKNVFNEVILELFGSADETSFTIRHSVSMDLIRAIKLQKELTSIINELKENYVENN